MPLPRVTDATAESLKKIAVENPQYPFDLLKSLEKTNPVLYNYLDYTIVLLNKKYSKPIVADIGSVLGMALGLLESQAEADDMEQQFKLDDVEPEN